MAWMPVKIVQLGRGVAWWRACVWISGLWWHVNPSRNPARAAHLAHPLSAPGTIYLLCSFPENNSSQVTLEWAGSQVWKKTSVKSTRTSWQFFGEAGCSNSVTPEIFFCIGKVFLFSWVDEKFEKEVQRTAINKVWNQKWFVGML